VNFRYIKVFEFRIAVSFAVYDFARERETPPPPTPPPLLGSGKRR